MKREDTNHMAKIKKLRVMYPSNPPIMIRTGDIQLNVIGKTKNHKNVKSLLNFKSFLNCPIFNHPYLSTPLIQTIAFSLFSSDSFFKGC